MKNNIWQYYAGTMVYNDSLKPDYLLFDEGMVRYSNSNYTYEYFLKDHLGNTRVVFQPNGQKADSLQITDYYPFGSTFKRTLPNNGNKYLYNGKELQDDAFVVSSDTINLDWYDYGARFYDPQIGRLTTQDPLGSIIPEINPYHYCFNNPVAYTDPSGMLPMLDYPNYISSAFVDPKGKIIKVIDDGDNNIYLVHDPSTWDGSSKDGLTIIGQTPTPTTLAGFEGKNLRSEEVINYIFDEADRLNKLGWLSWQILAHLENIAQLNRDREEVIKLLKEMKKLRKDQLILLLEMMKKEEVYLNYLQSQPSIKTVAGIRLIVSLIGTLMGNIVGIETTDVSGKSSDYIIPSSRYDEIDAEVEAQAKKIISKYDEMIKKIQSR